MLNLLMLFITLSCLPACSKTKQAPEPPTIVQESVLPQGWYSHDVATLNSDLEQYLTLAQKEFPVASNPDAVKALISPHASYYYSGLCAATAYQALLTGSQSDTWETRKNKNITRVIVLSPAHTMVVHGVALPPFTLYKTALGDISLDFQSLYKLSKHDLFNNNPQAFAREHAIEMQLPYLQKTVENFTLIPLIVGNLKNDEPMIVAKELGKIIDEHTLVVISSDFVHYGKSYEYEPCTQNILPTIRMMDSYAAQAITHQSLDAFCRLLNDTEATICGQMPLKVLLCLLERKTLGSVQTQTCCYYTSAQLMHAKQKDKTILVDKLFDALPDEQAQTSVSYLGMVMNAGDPSRHSAKSLIPQGERLPSSARPEEEPNGRRLEGFERSNSLKNSLTGYEQKALLKWARATLTQALRHPDDILSPPIISSGLEQQSGAFVTLKRNNNLRGCVGRVTTPDPLYKTIKDMALAAALQDTRFTPVTANELDSLVIDITILSQPVLAESYKDIVLGKHGIILQKINPETANKTASAIFLPHIPEEQGWDLETTLEQLSLKAGLSKNSWKTYCQFYLFEGFKISE